MKGKEISKYCVDTLKQLGADKVQVWYIHSTKKEMAVDGDKVSLLRTVHTDDINLQVIRNKKEAILKINKIDKSSLDNACNEVLALVESSQEDLNKDIAPKQDRAVFEHGVKEPDFEEMYEKLFNFKKQVAEKYPKIIIRDVVIFHQYNTTYLANSNEVDMEICNGYYEMFPMFTAKDGKKTSSFNYDIVTKENLNGEFLEWGQINNLLEQTEKQTDLKAIPGKFEGDIVLTPLCLASMVDSLTGELKDGKHITDTSLMKGKLGQKVLSKKFTLKAQALGDGFAEKNFVTGDGFISENLTVFEDGVLKSNLLSQYGANKTGQERALNTGVNFVVESGDKKLESIIKGIKKGILLQRFSGGMPASNGDFSGVAKNSFYIEDGQIKYAVNETMITGNIIDMFKNIVDISKESVNYGHSILPWVHTTGFTISGK